MSTSKQQPSSQPASFTLGELTERFGLQLHGDPQTIIDGVGTLQGGGKGKISFLSNRKYRRFLDTTGVSAVIIGAGDLDSCNTAALVATNPYVSYARVAALFSPTFASGEGVHSSAVVDPDAVIGEGASVGPLCVVGSGVVLGSGAVLGPGCVIEPGVHIGKNTRLRASVTVCHSCRIGSNVLIHPGTVIGADGFGIAPDQGQWVKVPQLGRVLIGDDVEIGANTTIDRGALEDTIIEDGVQLDNQIQIAHNVVVGKNTAIAGSVAVAGSTRIGKNCLIGGAAGITGHLEIADGVTVTAMSFVTKSIKQAGVYSSAVPVQPSKDWNRSLARLRKLDDLERRLAELEQKTNSNPD